MNFLMLRGQVPQDRDPQEIVFDYIAEVDDMWTQLFYNMLSFNTERGDKGLKFVDQGELWYWGGTRTKLFNPNFVERWVPSFDTYETEFVPDVIFCRGGFQEYHTVLKRFPEAIKIYYGAGNRFMPQPGFSDYDIILQDSPEQVEECKAKHRKALVTLFVKPAADNIFYPIKKKKEYDVCFPANGSQPFKGHDFVYSTVPKDISVLNLGNPSRVPHPENVTSYRVLRSEMAEHIAKCKVGIVVVQGNIDSCPRVIPEMLACNMPIVAMDHVRFWKDKYMESIIDSSSLYSTGEIAYVWNFWNVVRDVLKHWELYQPRIYYDHCLSMDKAVEFLLEKIKEVRE